MMILPLTVAVQSETSLYYETVWEEILQENVHQGEKNGVTLALINYKRIKSNPKFDILLALVDRVDLDTLKTDEDKLAFWTNVYNIATIHMVISHYPLDSIRTARSLFKSVWKRPAIHVDGNPYTLDHIEHRILR